MAERLTNKEENVYQDEEDILDVEVEDEETALSDARISVSNGRTAEGKGDYDFLVAGQLTKTGQPADRYSLWSLVQFAMTIAYESGDYGDPRREVPRSATRFPMWGVTNLSPQRTVRLLTEFWFFPIAWLDEKKAWIKVDEELTEVNILHPYWIPKIPGDRLWALWANHGPFAQLRTHEGREEVRRQYPYFSINSDYDYSLVQDPWHPSSWDYFKALNPRLSGLQVRDEDHADKVRKWFRRNGTQWAYMNGTLQKTWCRYIAALILGNALEHAAFWDPLKTQIDFHWNERHDVVTNVVNQLVTTDKGVPIYHEDGGVYRPNLLPLPEHQDRLLRSQEDVVRRYQETRGYGRVDFDPRPDQYRDLTGNYFDAPDSEKGIVSDIERMAEVEYRLPFAFSPGENPATVKKTQPIPTIGEWIGKLVSFFKRDSVKKIEQEEWAAHVVRGPKHSAVDLLAELPAEALVIIGKYLRHAKILSREHRLFSVGEQKISHLESDTGSWLGTHVPGMAERILADANYYLQFLEWWNNFADSKKGTISSFLRARVPTEDFYGIVEGSPFADFRRVCAALEYFKFDPGESWYGYESDGTPRVPNSLLKRLVKEPSLRGINLTASDGRGVLEHYREREGVLDSLRTFWSAAEDDRWQDLQNRLGFDYLTLSYCFWRPMDQAGDLENGFLYELWRNQPVEPFELRLKHQMEEAKLNRITNLLKVVVDNTEGFPCELHGRKDIEEVIREARQDAVLWMRARGSEKTYIGGARAFTGSVFGSWVDGGFPFRTKKGRPWEEWMYNQTGLETWLNPVYDNLFGLAESNEAWSMTGDERASWEKSKIQSRGVNLWYGARKRPQDGNFKGQEIKTFQLDWISEWIMGYAGLSQSQALVLAEIIRDKPPGRTVKDHWEKTVKEAVDKVKIVVDGQKVGLDKDEKSAVREVTFTFHHSLVPDGSL